jgi:hypothetical protein
MTTEMTGTTVESMPTPRPEMITVAGPVVALLAMSLVGLNSCEVKYSVALPMTMPVIRPTTMAPQMPAKFGRSSHLRMKNEAMKIRPN